MFVGRSVRRVSRSAAATATELAVEALDATGGVDELLLTGEEGVRAGPDFDRQRGDGGADGHDDLAAEVHLALGVVLGMNVGLHGFDLASRGSGGDSASGGSHDLVRSRSESVPNPR